MAFSNGPKIITDGLVLNLSAFDRNSYVSGSTTWNDVSGAVLYDDEYSESSDIGLTFSARYHDGGDHTPVEILYTTTDVGVDIDLQYSIKYHTANNSPR
jgi:hypothetical protein